MNEERIDIIIFGLFLVMLPFFIIFGLGYLCLWLVDNYCNTKPRYTHDPLKRLVDT